MSPLRWIADKLIARAVRTPYSHLKREDGEIYMYRYWLVPFTTPTQSGPAGVGPVPWSRPIARLLQLADISIRVHHIAGEDRDRHMHDHPGAFVSVILRGWYVERMPLKLTVGMGAHWNGEVEFGRQRMRGQYSVTLKQAYDRHQITLVPEGGAWTLFIMFRRTNEWGFYTPRGKVPSREYRSTNRITTDGNP